MWQKRAEYRDVGRTGFSAAQGAERQDGVAHSLPTTSFFCAPPLTPLAQMLGKEEADAGALLKMSKVLGLFIGKRERFRKRQALRQLQASARLLKLHEGNVARATTGIAAKLRRLIYSRLNDGFGRWRIFVAAEERREERLRMLLNRIVSAMSGLRRNMVKKAWDVWVARAEERSAEVLVLRRVLKIMFVSKALRAAISSWKDFNSEQVSRRA